MGNEQVMRPFFVGERGVKEKSKKDTANTYKNTNASFLVSFQAARVVHLENIKRQSHCKNTQHHLTSSNILKSSISFP